VLSSSQVHCHVSLRCASGPSVSVGSFDAHCGMIRTLSAVAAFVSSLVSRMGRAPGSGPWPAVSIAGVCSVFRNSSILCKRYLCSGIDPTVFRLIVKLLYGYVPDVGSVPGSGHIPEAVPNMLTAWTASLN
jgi:hypothetical protein